MAMPAQTEIIKRLRNEAAEHQTRISGLIATVKQLTEENETLTAGNLKLQEAMEHQRAGLQANLDECKEANQRLLVELTKFREEAYASRDATTDAVAEVDSRHFDERQDLLKGLEKMLIALGRAG